MNPDRLSPPRARLPDAYHSSTCLVFPNAQVDAESIRYSCLIDANVSWSLARPWPGCVYIFSYSF